PRVGGRELVTALVREVAQLAALEELVALQLQGQPGVLALEAPAPVGRFLPDVAAAFRRGAAALPAADVLVERLERLLGRGAFPGGRRGQDRQRGENHGED